MLDLLFSLVVLFELWGGREKHIEKACLPTEHDDCRYPVRGEYLPKKEGEFEDNVGDVENCQQPLISISH